MTCHLPAHRRRGALQTFGNVTNRGTGSDPLRDVLSLGQCKRSRRAPPDRRNEPTKMRDSLAGAMTTR
jgi:hypothetical protein